MNIHISVKGQNARISMRKLPKKNRVTKPTLKTSTGVVEHQTLANGKQILKPEELEALSYETLTTGNPEINVDKAGRILTHENLTSAYHKPDELTPARNFHKVDMTFNAAGQLKARTPEKTIHTNMNDSKPLIVDLEKTLPANLAATRFAFKDAHQLVHKDGLTREYLMKLAKILQESNSCALLGSGKNGKGPLILQENGKPCRGFLFGQVQNSEYKLLVMFTDMEMKTVQEIEKIQSDLKETTPEKIKTEKSA
jgi:hypothetical protein